MTPEERKELLRSRDKDQRADHLEADSIIEQDELVRGETDEEREDWRAERAAALNPVPPVRETFDMLAFVRGVLDPQVFREAADVGCGPTQMAEIKRRMQEWTDAVRLRPEEESSAQREIRLRELHSKMYSPGREQGCGCQGTGMIRKRGDFRRRDGRVMSDVEFLSICSCDLGQGKREFIKEMHRGRRRKKKPKDEEDAIPF